MRDSSKACETFHNKIVMISLSCLQRHATSRDKHAFLVGADCSEVHNWARLIHREALKEETVAIVVNLMKEQAEVIESASMISNRCIATGGGVVMTSD